MGLREFEALLGDVRSTMIGMSASGTRAFVARWPCGCRATGNRAAALTLSACRWHVTC